MDKAIVFSVVGLGFGDEGKGTTVDYLVRKHGARSVVCFTGGPQKAHHVVSPDGSLHCFSQFGSGTMIPGVRTHISSQTFFKPDNLLREAETLRRIGVSDALVRLTIDPRAGLVTDLHGLIGRLLEMSRGENRLGSVGMGVGQAVLDRKSKGFRALTVCDLYNKSILRAKIEDLWDEKIEQAEMLVQNRPDQRACLDDFLSGNSPSALTDSYSEFAKVCTEALLLDEEFLELCLKRREVIVLEAGQGTLLDPLYGFVPYVTKTPTTSASADRLLAPWMDEIELIHVGAVRAYGHRHGAGPFVTFDPGFSSDTPDLHNQTNQWQGKFLTGWFDLPAVRYAISVNPGLSFISLTCVDRLKDFGKVCTSYEYFGDDPKKLDTYFLWEVTVDGRFKVNAFKKLDSPSEERTRLLAECKPLDIEEVDSTDPLQFAAQLQEMLGVPIGILSNGPTADQKIDLRGIS